MEGQRNVLSLPATVKLPVTPQPGEIKTPEIQHLHGGYMSKLLL